MIKGASLLIQVTLIAALFSACNTSTPSAALPTTIQADDVEGTGIAGAFTALAETHNAFPTNTFIPASETPSPTLFSTNTAVPLLETATATEIPATATSTITQTVQAGGANDPCNAPLSSGPDGESIKGIKIQNASGAPITVSVYLNLTSYGVCGYRGYNLAKDGAVTITDLVQGCYSVSAFINDPKKPTKSFGYGCINNPDLWTFIVYRDQVKLNPP